MNHIDLKENYLQAEEIASAEALGQKTAWHIRETTRRPEARDWNESTYEIKAASIKTGLFF